MGDDKPKPRKGHEVAPKNSLLDSCYPASCHFVSFVGKWSSAQTREDQRGPRFEVSESLR